MTEFVTAKKLLQSGRYTCVLCKNGNIYLSEKRGVKPLVMWLDSGADFSGYSAADKVVGKGAAFLYVLLKVKEIYASVISKGALSVLNQYGIQVEYGTLVENIINRTGTGICPFEDAVADINEADAAYTKIVRKMKEMNI